MRAVVLGDKATIDYLNANFVNLYVLNLDLKRQRDAKGLDGVSPLERAIIGGWNKDSPVDCEVISSKLKLLRSLPLHDFLDENVNNEARGYRKFLKHSLAETPPEV